MWKNCFSLYKFLIWFLFFFFWILIDNQFRWYTNNSTRIWHISVWSTGSVHFKPCSVSRTSTLSPTNPLLELSISSRFTNHLLCPPACRSSTWSHGLESRHDWVMEHIILRIPRTQILTKIHKTKQNNKHF